MNLEKTIGSKWIFFTEECKIDMGPFTQDSIKLCTDTKKRGDRKTYNLINRPLKNSKINNDYRGDIFFWIREIIGLRRDS